MGGWLGARRKEQMTTELVGGNNFQMCAFGNSYKHILSLKDNRCGAIQLL